MQSGWLEESAIRRGSEPGVISRITRRMRVAIGAALSALLVVGGLGLVATPAQAADASDGVAGINTSILLLVDPGTGDASTTTLTRENVVVTGYSRGSGYTGQFLPAGYFFADPFSDGDSTVTPLWLFTTLNQYDATYSVAVSDATGNVIQTIAIDPSPAAVTGPLSGYPNSTFTLTQTAAGARTVALTAIVPNTVDVTESDFELADFEFYAGFNATTGELGNLITDATDSGTLSVTSDATYITISGTMTFPSTSFDTRIVGGFLDVEIAQAGAAFFAAGTSVVLSAAPTPDSGGGGGSSSTPAATTPAATTPTTPAPAPVAPVVFADPNTVTAAEIAALTPEQVATITPEQFGALDPAAFAGFTPDQVRAMNLGQINAIRPARAAELSIPAVLAMNGSQLFTMRPASVAALKPLAVELLTAEQLASVRPEAFKLMSRDMLRKLRPIQSTSLNQAQIKAINQDEIKGLRLDTLREFDRSQIRDLRPKQIENMSDRQLIALVESHGTDLRKRQEDAVVSVFESQSAPPIIVDLG